MILQTLLTLQVSGLTESLPPLRYALSALGFGLLTAVIALYVLRDRFESDNSEPIPEEWDDHQDGTQSPTEVADDEPTDEEEPPIDSPNVESISERQLGSLAPHNVKEGPDYDYLRTGKDTYQRSFFVSGWPDEMGDGQLREFYSQSGLRVDGGLVVDPVDSSKARDRLKSEIEELEADAQLAREDGNTVEATDIERELGDYRGMRNTIRDTSAELFDVGLYLSVISDDEKQLDRQSSELKDLLVSNGFEITRHRKQQQATHQSVMPTLDDKIGMQQAMMSAAIGGLNPWSSGTLINETGIPLGEHAENGSPIIYDRFTHDRGYNWLTIGNIGAGKSFSTKLHFLRRRMYDPDTILVMLDPLEGFAGLASALDSRPVMVGGSTGLNPLEIKRVPQEILDNNPELDPGKAKLKDLKSFFQSFFELRNEELGERWDTLSRAIKMAYEEVGINLDDPTTHGRPDPTIQDHLVPVLLDMIVNEEDNSILNDVVEGSTEHDLSEVFEQARGVTDRERERAIDLLLAMESFLEGNALSNMGGESDFEMGDESSLYLDLQQQEGRGSLGLMMNLLFSSVYERAKQTDKNVIFAIDEARYIMRDRSALEFLEQAVRHSRHYDLSIQFITQTVDEFFQHPESEAIADQCDHKLFFHTEGIDEEIAEKVGMNAVQAQFIRNATPGDEETGYSEACLQVADEGWYPIHIRAMDEEAAIVDLDPTTDVEEALPGMVGDEELPARVKQLREYLLSKQATTKQRQPAAPDDPPIPETEIPTDDGVEVHVDREALQNASTSVEDLLAARVEYDQPQSEGYDSDSDPDSEPDREVQTPAETADTDVSHDGEQRTPTEIQSLDEPVDWTVVEQIPEPAADQLHDHGITTIRELYTTDTERLTEIPQVGDRRGQRLIAFATELYAELSATDSNTDGRAQNGRADGEEPTAVDDLTPESADGDPDEQE